jgi:PII-like signaling protein
MTESKREQVTLVRVYLTEEEAHLKTLLKRLHDWGLVRGVTVFRGIAGFGDSGMIHGSSLVDMSLNLPVVLEFFEQHDKAAEVIAYLQQEIGPGHIVSWPVQLDSLA